METARSGGFLQWEDFQSKTIQWALFIHLFLVCWRFAIGLDIWDHALEKTAPSAVGHSHGQEQGRAGLGGGVEWCWWKLF